MMNYYFVEPYMFDLAITASENNEGKGLTLICCPGKFFELELRLFGLRGQTFFSVAHTLYFTSKNLFL